MPREVQVRDAGPEAIRRIRKVLQETYVRDGPRPALAKVGVRVTNAVKEKLSQPGTGRLYRRGNVQHRASAPGSPPAVDTGRYRSSWRFVLGRDSQGHYVDIGTDVKYGPYLEYGTSRMAARPHVRPAVNEERVGIQNDIAAALLAQLNQEVRSL